MGTFLKGTASQLYHGVVRMGVTVVMARLILCRRWAEAEESGRRQQVLPGRVWEDPVRVMAGRPGHLGGQNESTVG